MAATGGKGVTGGPGEGFKDDCSSHGHARSRHYGTHRLVEVMNVPRAGGVMSGRLMTGWSAQLPASPRRAGGAVRGQGGGRGGHSGVFSRRRQAAAGPQDCGICWQRVGLGGSLAAALCSVRKLYSYCGGTDRQQSVCGPLSPVRAHGLWVRACARRHPVGWSLSVPAPRRTGSASATTPAANTPADRVPGCTPGALLPPHRRSSPHSWREPHWQGQTWVSAQT